MLESKKHIVFVIPSLAAGGAERIFAFLAQHLDKKLFRVTLLVVGFKKQTVYSISNETVVYLNKQKVSLAIGRIFSFLKNENPDIVISSIVHLNTIMAFISWFFPNTKFVAREANVLSVLKHYNMSRLLPKPLVVFAYKFFDKLIAQSIDMKRDMIKNYGVKEEKISLINNPITSEYNLKNTKVNGKLRFVTIGRLSKEKGFDRLLNALSKLSFPFSYTIIGDGIEKEKLFNQAKDLKILNKIRHISYTSEIEKELQSHDLFLQGSYVEGFPNVLLESCCVGTPILAFNAPGGLDEIIENGKNGFVAPDDEVFVKYLESLNENFSFTPEEVRKVVIEKFNAEKILTQYQELFLSL